MTDQASIPDASARIAIIDLPVTTWLPESA